MTPTKTTKEEKMKTNSLCKDEKKTCENIKLIMDEDFFANEQLKMSEEKRKEMSKRWFEIHYFVKKSLLDTKRISKITFRRWDNVIWRKYGYLRHEIMMPSEYNEKMGIKPVNLKYFNNACNKIKNELSKLNKEVSNGK